MNNSSFMQFRLLVSQGTKPWLFSRVARKLCSVMRVAFGCIAPVEPTSLRRLTGKSRVRSCELVTVKQNTLSRPGPEVVAEQSKGSVV